MRYFEATTPMYMIYGAYGFGLDPPEWGCDYCIVAARNKRQARIKAYKFWTKDHNHKNYFYDCCTRSHPPFKHIELIELTEQQVKPYRGSSYYVE